uniref:Ig-like domain-containing protein n=1 Tax=Terrapene triunguis TaxID=2587831 RepID=A0A674J1L2_9SAUR
MSGARLGSSSLESPRLQSSIGLKDTGGCRGQPRARPRHSQCPGVTVHPAEPPLTPPFPLQRTHFPDFNARSQLSPSSTGIHTEQVHVGCALSDQAPMDPRFQYAYDGGDFISFDNQTGTWVAAVQLAVPVKQLWETGDKFWTQFVQRYLQHECLETLQSLGWVSPAPEPDEHPPTHTHTYINRANAPDSSITLSCHARGFYPRPIHVSWVRDGEDILAETDSSGILPNDIHSYYTQSSLEISPQQEDGHRYACRVEHSSLEEPVLVWAPGKKGPLPPGVLAAIVLAVLVLAGAVGAGVILWRRKSAGKSRSHGAGVWGVGRPSQPKGEWLLPLPPRRDGAGPWGRADHRSPALLGAEWALSLAGRLVPG